jgi:hypothetical protein
MTGVLLATTAAANPVIDGTPPSPRPPLVPPRNAVPVVVEMRDGEAQPFLIVPRSLLQKGRRVASAGRTGSFASSPATLVAAGLGLSMLLALGGLQLVRRPGQRLSRRMLLLLAALLAPLVASPLLLAKARLPDNPPLPPVRLTVEGVEVRGGSEGLPIRLVLPRAEAERMAKELGQQNMPPPPVRLGAPSKSPG